MQHLRNLAFVASILLWGLSPAGAMSHGGEDGHGGHHGPPPPPPEMAEIIEDILEDDDLSEAAATMLGHLIGPPPAEGEEPPAPPEISAEEMEAAKEEIAELLSDLLEEGIPEPAEKWIHIVLGHMAGDHGNGGDHGPPPPPESMAEIIEEILTDEDYGLSDAAATMLGHLLMSTEEREQAGGPDISAEEMDAGADEIAELFADLLEEDVPEEAEKYINLILGHMAGKHIEEHNGD